MSKIINLENITKSYKSGDGKVHAVKDITFSLEEGESLAIVGPSGSGKSTLLNIIGGLDKPNSGKVQINSQSISEFSDNQLSKFRNKTIGFIFQFFNLQDYSTAWENVALPMILSGVKEKIAKRRSIELLTKIGLENRIHHYPKQLSGGEMQRVAVARSLANDPKILLADEPTANLDRNSAEKVLDLFDEIARTGVSVVVITHDNEVSKKFKNILKLKDGQVTG
jgi:putative ABC transport system ATP-binding protein